MRKAAALGKASARVKYFLFRESEKGELEEALESPEVVLFSGAERTGEGEEEPSKLWGGSTGISDDVLSDLHSLGGSLFLLESFSVDFFLPLLFRIASSKSFCSPGVRTMGGRMAGDESVAGVSLAINCFPQSFRLS